MKTRRSFPFVAGLAGAAAVAAMFAFAQPAAAQTCASPLELPAVGWASGNTCALTNSLPSLQGIPSPQPDAVYRIPRGYGTQFIALQAGSSSLTAFVIKPCGTSGNIQEVTDIPAQGAANLTVTKSPSADSYLVVTGNPADPPVSCGTYSVSRKPMPTDACPDAIPLHSGQSYAGDTCSAAPLSLDMGGFAVNNRADVYRFNPADLTDRHLYFQAADFDLEVLVATSCSTAPVAVAAIAAGNSGVLDVSALVSGEYRLVVTGDLATIPGDCGAYSMSDRAPGVVYDRATLLAQLAPGYYSEAFSAVPQGGYPGSLTFSQGTFAFSVSAAGSPPSGLWNGPGVISTASASDALRIDFIAAPVLAFGANVWATDAAFNFAAAPVTVTLDDGRSFKFHPGGSDDFRALRFDAPVQWLTISTQPGSGTYPTLDNVVIGQ